MEFSLSVFERVVFPTIRYAAIILLLGMGSPAEEVLATIGIGDRGKLEFVGETSTGTNTVQEDGNAPISVQGELARISFRVTSGKQVLASGAISRMPKFGDNPHVFFRALGANSTPMHTVFVIANGTRPEAFILDHSATPAVVRTVDFPDDVKLRGYNSARAIVNWDASTPNQIQVKLLSGTNLVKAAKISLLTGLFID